jgi:hypothetical protein
MLGICDFRHKAPRQSSSSLSFYILPGFNTKNINMP